MGPKYLKCRFQRIPALHGGSTPSHTRVAGRTRENPCITVRLETARIVGEESNTHAGLKAVYVQ